MEYKHLVNKNKVNKILIERFKNKLKFYYQMNLFNFILHFIKDLDQVNKLKYVLKSLK